MQGDMCHGDGVTHPTHLPWGWGTPQQLLCMSLLEGGGGGGMTGATSLPWG